jgi:hypothetical protein
MRKIRPKDISTFAAAAVLIEVGFTIKRAYLTWRDVRCSRIDHPHTDIARERSRFAVASSFTLVERPVSASCWTA